MVALCRARYSDEVRRLLKGCSEEVLEILTSHREALDAGVQALASRKELLGSEVGPRARLGTAASPAHGFSWVHGARGGVNGV